MNTGFKNFNENVCSKFDAVKSDINDLRESNIQLVHLMANSPDLGSSSIYCPVKQFLTDGNASMKSSRVSEDRVTWGHEQKSESAEKNRGIGQKMPRNVSGSSIASNTKKRGPQKRVKQVLKGSSGDTAECNAVIGEQVNDLVFSSAVPNGELSVDNNGEGSAAGDFKVVERRRRNRPHLTFGTDETSGFSGIPRHAWLYIGRVQSGTTSKHVKPHLITKCPDTDFKVESLRSDDRGCSFKIGFDIAKLNYVSNPNIWPRNVTIRRFNFRNGFFRSAPSGSKEKERVKEAGGVPPEHSVPKEQD